MNTKHTPGPWVIHGDFQEIHPANDDDGTHVIADIDPDCERTHREANARLIAAAPELLAELLATGDALTELCSLLLRGQFDAAEDWAKANADELARSRAATIAKATGHD